MILPIDDAGIALHQNQEHGPAIRLYGSPSQFEQSIVYYTNAGIITLGSLGCQRIIKNGEMTSDAGLNAG
ncbi:hypothetical protein GCM10022278_34740 [Allohahella marinimesophila]|uniref:Uncharacterized protein n=1 Tax=Allohahella marinimesophila TaxID=1054972 RepID=A0ABP7Q1H3_9GAMM